MQTQYCEPSPSYLSKSFVESFAQKIADKLQFHYSDDLFSLINKIGGEISVGYTGYDDFEGGSIIVDENVKFSILISPFTSIERDRFTIAHELGHLFLHYPQVRSNLTNGKKFRATRYIDNTNKEQQIAEREANWFAAAFLMPEQAFKESYNISAKQAELDFKLSSSAIRIRAKSLGIKT